MLIDLAKVVELKNECKNKTVVHLGAHKGEECHTYNQINIGRIIWIEGNEELIDELKNNIELYKNIKHEIHHVVIGEKDLEKKIFYITDFSQSSSLLELDEHKFQHPWVHVKTEKPVITRRLDKYFEEQNVQDNDFMLLNIDLQGYELSALKSLGTYLDKFKWINTEVNLIHLYKDCPLISDIDNYLFKYGFVRCQTKFTKNFWGDALYKKNKNYLQYFFKLLQAYLFEFFAVILVKIQKSYKNYSAKIKKVKKFFLNNNRP